MHTPKEQGDLIHRISPEELDSLSKGALEARAGAYCPYSHFRVGAALLLRPAGASSSSDKQAPQVIRGANVENAAYPVGTCAERVAVGTAVASHGCRRGDIHALAVATDLSDDYCSPCGMCRQFLREFLHLDTPIFMLKRDGEYVVKTMGELLPMSFGPDVLPPPDRLLAQRRDDKEGNTPPERTGTSTTG